MSYLKTHLFSMPVEIRNTFWSENEHAHVSIQYNLSCRIGQYRFGIAYAAPDSTTAQRKCADYFLGFCRALHLSYDEDDFNSAFPDYDPFNDDEYAERIKTDIPF